MDFDLEDVGEFINDNPQIPIAAGLMAGQAVHRNVQRARQDAASIKKGLDAIQRQNDEARRLALNKEQREKALAENRDFLFQLSISLGRILGHGYSLAGYFEIEDLAHDLKARNLTTTSFADYRDKERLVDVERKVTEAKEIFAQQVDSETRDRISEVAKWDFFTLKVRHMADFACELRDKEKAQESTQAELGEVPWQNVPSIAQYARCAEIKRRLSALKDSMLNIRGIDPDTLSFAASPSITAEQRGKLLEDCDEYICNLLGSLGVSASNLPTIRRLHDLHPA